MSYYVFDKLYKLDGRFEARMWAIAVCETQRGEGMLIRQHGVVGKETTQKIRLVKEGKNVGKVNETSPYEQAKAEAQSMHTKKIDQGYTTDYTKLETPFIPMTLHEFSKHMHKIQLPCIVQPKLNGVRVLARHGCPPQYISKSGKVYTVLSHWDEEVQKILQPGECLDGEAYVHGMYLPDIVSAIKKEGQLTPLLEYHVFDMLDLHTPYRSRQVYLHNIIRQFKDLQIIKYVPTYHANTLPEVHFIHEILKDKGYEGSVVRNYDGMYRLNYRSYDVQKMIDYISEEYTITGMLTDRDGCIIFECTRNGTCFHVVPKGSKAYRRELVGEDLIGAILTVQYKELSPYGVPIGNPVGILRDYE